MEMDAIQKRLIQGVFLFLLITAGSVTTGAQTIKAYRCYGYLTEYQNQGFRPTFRPRYQHIFAATITKK
jgi:hypothetical protein